MLRWLSSTHNTATRHHSTAHAHTTQSTAQTLVPTLTDDPLATIALHTQSTIYAVSRVNPIFREEEEFAVAGCGGKRAGGGKEAARGGSQGRGGGGSSGYSSKKSSATTGSGGSNSDWSGSGSGALLSPIPEGRLPPLCPPHSVPRPVWPPRRPRLDAHAFIGQEGVGGGGGGGDMHAPEHLLRSLSHTISLAVDHKVMPPEQVLRSLGETINRSLEAIAAAAAASGGSREPLYDCSSASSSGFSDLTASPSSSTHSTPSSHSPSTPSTHSHYEKLIRLPPPPLYEAPPVPTKHNSNIDNPFMCRGPDFTLDAHQADLLMRKLKQSKRQRCWCRAVTSLMALFFFLFSVMLVSMLLTRGKRFFGSL